MKHELRHRDPRNYRLVLILGSLAIGVASQSASAAEIVSANSYKSEVRNAALVDVNAYHSHTCSELQTDLARGPAAKPILISDDGGALAGCVSLSNCPTGPSGLDAGCTQVFANKIAQSGQHYEHLSAYLATKVEGGGSIQNGWTDLSPDDQTALQHLRTHATPLVANGTLYIAKDSSGNGRFFWNKTQVTLMGFGFYGAVVSNRVNATNYLDALKMGPVPGNPSVQKGVNLTRIWLTDMWTALDAGTIPLPPTGQPPVPAPTGGITPFVENTSLPNISERYDLTQMNDAFFVRLRDFVQKAWDRGIVVQVSLFDRNGVRNNRAYGYGGWWGSPYNRANNPYDVLTDPPVDKHPPDFLSSRCDYHRGLGRAHRELVVRTLLELKDFGNVIFEIMNEPEGGQDTAGDWDNRLVTWHEALAQVMDDTLTTSPRLGWDRFDSGPALASLANQESRDCASVPWKTSNAVYSAGTGRITNPTTSVNLPRANVWLDTADLPLSMPITVEVKGNVPSTASAPNNWFAVALFSDNGVVTAENVFANGQIWMLMRQSGIWKVFANGTQIVLGSGTASVDPNALKTIQLRYYPQFKTVSAWINGVMVVNHASLGTFNPNIKRAGFDSFTADAIPAGSVQIDDFEVRVNDATPYGPVRVHWVQPQPLAPWAPPNSLVVGGSALGPAGSVVTLRWRNVTDNGDWVTEPFTPSPDAAGIWFHAIPANAQYGKTFAVQATFSGGAVSPTCIYPGSNTFVACP